VSLFNLFSWYLVFLLFTYSIVYFLNTKKRDKLNRIFILGITILISNWLLFLIQATIYSQSISIRQWILNITLSISAITLLIGKLELKMPEELNSINLTKVEMYVYGFLRTALMNFFIVLPILSIHHMPGSYSLGMLDLFALLLWLTGIFFLYNPKVQNQRVKFFSLMSPFWAFYFMALSSVSSYWIIIFPIIGSYYLFKVDYQYNKN
jgi:hypothetical protein